MLASIEVALKPELKDALGEKLARRMREDLGLSVEACRTIRIYLVEADISHEDLLAFASGPLCDPVTEIYSVERPLAPKFGFDWLIQVGFRPGVTDNEGKVAKEALELLIGRSLNEDENVYSLTQYLIRGHLSHEEVERIAKELLANELIERFWIVSQAEFNVETGLETPPPKVTETHEIKVEVFDLSKLSDEELLKLSKERLLALNLKEMQTIKEFFTANQEFLKLRQKYGLDYRLTDVELESLAQTWSEHCKHKIFNAKITYTDKTSGKTEIIDSLFKTYIRKSTEEIRKAKGERDFCLSVFVDNAGVIKLNDKWNVAMKVETHNSPSALDPYGGALTGIVGVNRDPFGTGKGALLVFNTDVFCFAPPNWKKPLPPRLLHPKRIFEGVREGVEHGGNKSGIPTVNGSIVFDPRYLGKPLVYCGTGGIMPAEVCGEPSWKKGARPGDLVVMVGGRIGKDGIHGATFSSEELHEGSPATAVQIGDPITQKKMFDFLLKARDECLYTSITDNGAGGLSSSVGEMARESGGAELDLEKAPLKYHGLQPWEILVSESQERMTVAVPPEHIDRFLELAKKMDVEATVLGQFTDSGFFHIRYQGKTVGLLPLDFLHDGVPQLELKAVWEPPKVDEPNLPEPEDCGEILKDLLSSYNICSKEYVVRQYDHEVQGGSVVKPLTGAKDDGPSDAAVLRPDLSAPDGLVVAHGICPKYSDIDTYWMAANAIDEAIRNAVCVGADIEHMAGLDNFCWCDPIQSEKTPDGYYKLAQLVRANQALYDFTTAFGVPCISGKDSMKNDYLASGLGLTPENNPFGVGVVLPDGSLKISIPPTLLFSILARIPDVTKALTLDVKRPEELVYILGLTRDELGGSEYFRLRGFTGSKVPKVHASSAYERYLKLRDAIYYGLVSAAHDCSDGGLAVTLAEMAFAGHLGIAIDLSAIPYEGEKRPDYLLFSESASRIVVTVPKDKQRDFENLFTGTAYALIGETITEPVFICRDERGKAVIEENIFELKNAWQKPLNW
ncbi:Phosphoribosylformylglycinamidine synthase [Thermodesulfatator indicus DSM 15286]|uniref:Phosphoribosylformylglycinamidine synthase subunit PurL n=1 Tax=Thermodesulfatator indicus (strain DSM 15286 / JCM 11887 / CIR29812) TaxID=667014 RepID=F8ACY0_THEID|nr:AIR synthase-related protein [Thermodesulfatator indicus]AEH44774.1 Phosphoribosylformylglycinamidine synthase [Thermodesulfatator indicus DSM 15286]